MQLHVCPKCAFCGLKSHSSLANNSRFSERLQCTCSLLCFEQLLQMAFKSTKEYKRNLSDLGPTSYLLLPVFCPSQQPNTDQKCQKHHHMPPGSSRRESGQHKPKQALRVSEDCAIEPGQGLDAEQKLLCGDVSGQRQGLDIKSMTNYDMKLQTLHVHSFSPRVSLQVGKPMALGVP